MSLEKSHTQFRTPTFAICLAVIIASGVALSARAQVGGMTTQSESANTRAQLNQSAEMAGTNSVPQLYEGEETDVGPQSVVAQERQTTFQAKVDEQLLYTDNVLLAPHHKIQSGVLISTAQFALAPTPIPAGTGTLSPRLGYQAQWFDNLFNDQKVHDLGDYHVKPFQPIHELNYYDFNAQSVFADALWTHEHLSLGGGMELTRMFYTSDYESFYEEEVPYWSARYVLPVGDKAAFSASYLGDYRFTRTAPDNFFGFHQSNVNDRTDHGLLLTWTEMLCKHAVFQPFYQFKYTRFTQAPNTFNPITDQAAGTTRNDYLNTLGAGLYWFVCPNCTIRGFVNYNILASSVHGAEYQEFDGGAGIDLSVKF